MYPLDLALLRLTIPFTEQELNEKYREALNIGIVIEDKTVIKLSSRAFLRINKELRRNPFLNKKNKNVDKNTYTVQVTEPCKKCDMVKVGEMELPSGKAMITCPKCKGHKKVFDKKKKIIPCNRCKGLGKVKTICKYCKGTCIVSLPRIIFDIN